MILIYGFLLRLLAMTALVIVAVGYIFAPTILIYSLTGLFFGWEHKNAAPIAIIASVVSVIVVFFIKQGLFWLESAARRIRKDFPGAKLTKKGGIWVYPSRAIGAYAMSSLRGGEVIVTSSTALMAPQMLNWIIEHEKAHLRHNDSSHAIWRINTAATARYAKRFSSLFLLPLAVIPGLNWIINLYQKSVIMVVNMTFGLMRVVSSFIDWRIEYRADREASLKTSFADGIQTLSLLRQSGIGGVDLQSFVGLSSHPPIALRVARLKKHNGERLK